MPPVRPDLFEFEFDPVAIRGVRNRLQLSQAALADWLDIPVNTISRWETGTTTPDAKALAALWSIANLRGIKPEFFKRRQGSETSNRTDLIVLWEYPLNQVDLDAIEEDWQYLKDYAGIRFPKTWPGIRGTVYSNHNGGYDYLNFEPLNFTVQSRSQRLEMEGLRIKRQMWGFSDEFQNDARAVCSEDPNNMILIVASNKPQRVPLIRELIDANIDTYIMPTTDDCPEELLDTVPSDHVIHRDEPFVVSECVKVIDALKGEPITRSEFGNRCKDRLNHDGVYPQDVGFSRRNPYGSVLRWLEANGVVRVVPTSGKGNRVRIYRLHRHLDVESSVSN